jgi:hypothetical protein
MMITWPDPYYHTSNDRPAACDPTQLKRVVFLGAAAAYTIAAAEDETVIKIATEIQGNAMQRMGHQLTISSIQIANTSKANFAEVYKNGIFNIDAVYQNEKETLESVSELFVNKSAMNKYLGKQLDQLENIYSSNLKMLAEQMKTQSSLISAPVVKLEASEKEKEAIKIIPVPTSKVTENGYRGYGKFMSELSSEIKEKYPYYSLSRTSSELERLCDGKRNALEIKKMIDVQYPFNVELEDVLNYIELLKLSGLVTY